MLIEISLTLLITITLFNVILGASFSDYTLESSYAQTIGIDALTGALAIIIVLIGIAVIVGLQIFGSGISEQSVKTIIVIVGYASIWGFFSILSINLILAIEIFGGIIYLILTIIYMIGVMNKLSQ